MMGRRSAALLCVLLAHALIIFSMAQMRPPESRQVTEDAIHPIAITLEPRPVDGPEPAAERPFSLQAVPWPHMAEPVPPSDAYPSGAEEDPRKWPQGVDWPLEGKLAAKRVLDAQEEAERVARMFAGPK